MQSSKSLVPRSISVLFLACLIFSGKAAAAFTINAVVNAASRTPPGVQSYGIAQGAVFAVTGTGVGQDPPVQATFPLPAAAGLAGVSIKITIGSTVLDAIMVYVSANEVDAILPSTTPVGAGTVTVNNSGTTATAPITVVKSAFGIFTNTPGGLGPALAFSVAGDGTTSLISPLQPVQSGQTVMLAGTGLGAISSDETQSGATDDPGASVTLWLGTTQVPVVSAGRGACCTGIDPAYPIPQGIAAWDVITFTIPDGISGCTVSVAVQTGNMVSNVSSIAIANSSGFCLDLSGLTFDPTNLSGTIKTGLIGFTRVAVKNYAATGTTDVTSDVGAASFQSADVGPTALNLPSLATLYNAVTGNCTVIVSRTDRANLPPTVPGTPGTPPALLDAGPAINVKGPAGSKSMPKTKDGSYAASLASVFNILPGLPAGGPPFLEPGSYAVDNGSGGADIGSFSINLNLPKPISWDNIDQVATVNRTQGVTVKWSGGDPATVVGIAGNAILIQGTVSLSGSFACTEKVSAGQFTVPPFVTLNMPQIALGAAATTGTAVMTVSNILYQYTTIPGVDFSIFTSTSGLGRNVGFQ